MTVAALPLGARAACGPDFEIPGFTFEQIDAQFSRAGLNTHVMNSARIATFWSSGWKHIVNLAKDNDVEVLDLLTEATDIIDLLQEERRRLAGFDYGERLHATATMRTWIEPLLLVPLDKTSFNVKNQRRLIAAMGGFALMAKFLVNFERKHLPAPTIHPMAPLTEAWMEKLLSSLQLHSLDLAVAEIERLRPFYQPDPLAKIHQALRAPLPRAAPAPVEAPTPDVIVAPAPTPATFIDLVRSNDPAFAADRSYDVELVGAHESSQRRLNVSLSEGLIEELHGDHDQQTKRLLRTLAAPQTNKSGLKRLDAVGPNIVELKAVLRGHWRIIGCLEKGHLRLLSLMNLPDTIAGYARRIPANLCR